MIRSRKLILSAATGYTWEQLSPFVESLRRSGCDADVLFLVNHAPHCDREKLADFGIRMWEIHPILSYFPIYLRRKLFSRRLGFLHRGYVETIDDSPISSSTKRLLQAWLGRAFHHIACARYFYYLAYLSKHATAYDHVLLTDVRDVIFQADPFCLCSNSSIEFFLEHRSSTISADFGNSIWVRKTCGDAVFAQIKHERISCSGVTFGKTDSILRYLYQMSRVLTQATERIAGLDGYDQGAHNWIVRSHEIPGSALLENGFARVLTMHGTPPEELRFDSQGALINNDGTLIPILHQYDRHPTLRSDLIRKLTTGP